MKDAGAAGPVKLFFSNFKISTDARATNVVSIGLTGPVSHCYRLLIGVKQTQIEKAISIERGTKFFINTCAPINEFQLIWRRIYKTKTKTKMKTKTNRSSISQLHHHHHHHCP